MSSCERPPKAIGRNGVRRQMRLSALQRLSGVYPRRSFHWPRSRRANRSLISPMTLAPSREPWTAGELMSELLGRRQSALHVVDGEDVFPHQEIENGHGDRSPDHGGSERATEGRVRHGGTPQKRPLDIP